MGLQGAGFAVNKHPCMEACACSLCPPGMVCSQLAANWNGRNTSTGHSVLLLNCYCGCDVETQNPHLAACPPQIFTSPQAPQAQGVQAATLSPWAHTAWGACTHICIFHKLSLGIILSLKDILYM